MADNTPNVVESRLIVMLADAKLLADRLNKAFEVMREKFRGIRSADRMEYGGIGIEWRMRRDRHVNTEVASEIFGSKEAFEAAFTVTTTTVDTSAKNMDRLVREGVLSAEDRAKIETFTSGQRALYITDNRGAQSVEVGIPEKIIAILEEVA